MPDWDRLAIASLIGGAVAAAAWVGADAASGQRQFPPESIGNTPFRSAGHIASWTKAQPGIGHAPADVIRRTDLRHAIDT